MDTRKRRILQAVVDDYVATAEPVGSVTLARKYNLGISPATIRNELADLEEQGYLEQPHASAGRIPSDKGYRFYVDYLAQVEELASEERRRLREVLDPYRGEVGALVQAAARFLGEATQYLVLLSVPAVSRARCRLVHFLPVPPDRVLLVLVAEDGQVHTTGVEAGPVSEEALQRAAAALNEQFHGLPLEEVERALAEGLALGAFGLGDLAERLAEAFNQRRDREQRSQVCVGGAPNLLRQPEFRDVEKARGLFAALEEERVLSELLALAPEEGVSVAIGEEWPTRPFEDCSLVSSGYLVGGRPLGRIGVLGPRRMEYGRVMSLIREVSRHITEMLDG